MSIGPTWPIIATTFGSGIDGGRRCEPCIGEGGVGLLRSRDGAVAAAELCRHRRDRRLCGRDQVTRAARPRAAQIRSDGPDESRDGARRPGRAGCGVEGMSGPVSTARLGTSTKLIGLTKHTKHGHVPSPVSPHFVAPPAQPALSFNSIALAAAVARTRCRLHRLLPVTPRKQFAQALCSGRRRGLLRSG